MPERQAPALASSVDSEEPKPQEPSLDPEAFSEIPCGPGGAPELAKIRASRGFDFLELRSAPQGSAPSEHSMTTSTGQPCVDRKSTRRNSRHAKRASAVFGLKKKKSGSQLNNGCPS